MCAKVIRANGGVITSEQLSPFLTPPELKVMRHLRPPVTRPFPTIPATLKLSPFNFLRLGRRVFLLLRGRRLDLARSYSTERDPYSYRGRGHFVCLPGKDKREPIQDTQMV